MPLLLGFEVTREKKRAYAFPSYDGSFMEHVHNSLKQGTPEHGLCVMRALGFWGYTLSSILGILGGPFDLVSLLSIP